MSLLTHLIGNTSLVRLQSLFKETQCEILAKCEFMNPCGSVKDRAAKYLLMDVEKKLKSPDNAHLKPKDVTIVEGSAGNTAIALLHLCRSKGFNAVMFMPNTQSQEKVDILKLLGAQVYPVPVKPFADPLNYNKQAMNYAKINKHHFWTDQFDNTANTKAHYETTGPEILRNCAEFSPMYQPAIFKQDGTPEYYKGTFSPMEYVIRKYKSHNLSAFVCGTGSGGTLAGVAKYIKQNSPYTRIVLADPPGACLFNAVKSRGLNVSPVGTNSITEGIGQGRITNNLAEGFHLIDDSVHIPDEETILMVFRLIDEEGILVGASSAMNIVAATKVAKMLGPGHRIVTILCDTGHKYQSRLFSKKWLESKNLYSIIPQKYRKYIIYP
eukprot:NODE_115_length_18417_cov_0.666012.p5 type:complete len:382 gc:universal NODE_115_length_18417_cov_0.666012:14422-13277(-)